MNNICKIELIPKQNGNFFYTIIIYNYSEIGKQLSFEGNPCGINPCESTLDYENSQLINSKIDNIKNNQINYHKTETIYEGISHKDIRNFLYNKTGLSRTDKLVLLYKKWAIGNKNLSITFQFD